MRYIAALDVGTTSVRCFVLNEKCEIIGSAVEGVELLNPQPGFFEIEPEGLWDQIVRVMQNAVTNAQLQPSQIACLGISTQRCTFLTWNHKTQEYFHNFITWKDLRSDALVDEFNNGLTLKTINGVSYTLYLLTRSSRFLAGSVLKMMNGQVTLRLVYEMQNNKRLREGLKRKCVRIELLDSWILYKLRSGNGKNPNVDHISDVTACTATGLFDPFILDWSPMIKMISGIEISLLPKIVNNSYTDFGHINPVDFGPEWQNCQIPITASISDQCAAIFGSQCFSKGDVKITMGTGAFLDLITGSSCHASIKGMYPLVAWQYGKNTTFCVEGAAHDMGTIITWGQNCGLYSNPAETSAIAESISDTNGVYFVPAFSGLGAPINDHKAASGFIGITPSTQKAHMVRALLESIVFRLVQLVETAEAETQTKLKILRVDGGVSRNDFVCQFLADATGIYVERSSNAESSIMGASYAAGINFGLWQSHQDVAQFRTIDRCFVPNIKKHSPIRERLKVWLKAVERFSHWY
ncbi:putative glycerol kinase 5 [Stomoxys calcitrans]|uniref:putative glycerol kinase 5 n=1 Tax=Stomoxys calcitrans TaxID=35570 RepID=UPI0027E38656|nr:putative glycerol kinase 5 [Stomoxys calcitrans]